MSTVVMELYDALREAGVDEKLARAAARAVLSSEGRTELATKQDLAALRQDLAELKATLVMWNVGVMVAIMTGIFSGIVKLV